MKVIVESNLYIRKVFEPPIELNFKDPPISIKDVLKSLENMCASIEFLGRNECLGRDVDEIFINEESCFSLRQGFQTWLKEGDCVKVKISMEEVGGG